MKNNTTAKLLTTALAATAIVIPVVANADWSGDIEGGTVVSGDGNGSKLRFKMSNSDRPLNQQFYADWIRGDSGSNSYKVGYEPQYWITDQTYVFGDASFDTGETNINFVDANNMLSSEVVDIDQRRNLFAGIGIQLLNSNSTNLFAEVGAGQTSTKFDSAAGFADQDTNSTVARVGASQLLTDFLRLELDADYTTSDNVDTTTADAGLALRMAGGSIKYTYRLNSTEIAGKKADTSDSFVSYSYSF